MRAFRSPVGARKSLTFVPGLPFSNVLITGAMVVSLTQVYNVIELASPDASSASPHAVNTSARIAPIPTRCLPIFIPQTY